MPHKMLLYKLCELEHDNDANPVHPNTAEVANITPMGKVFLGSQNQALGQCCASSCFFLKNCNNSESICSKMLHYSFKCDTAKVQLCYVL